MTDLLGILMYYGGFGVPLAFFLIGGRRRRARKAMLIGIGLQFFCTLAVFGFVEYSRRSGYADYYYGMALLILVNLCAVVWYAAAIWKNRGPT